MNIHFFKIKNILPQLFLVIIVSCFAVLLFPKIADASVTIYGYVYGDNEMTQPVEGASMGIGGEYGLGNGTDKTGYFEFTVDRIGTTGEGLTAQYSGLYIKQFPKVGTSEPGYVEAESGSYYAYCDADNCNIPALETGGGGSCSTIGSSNFTDIFNKPIIPIGEDGSYGYEIFAPDKFRIGSVTVSGSGVTKNQDGTYTINAAEYSVTNRPKLTWYTSLDQGTTIGTYDGYLLQGSVVGGSDKKVYCLNSANGKCDNDVRKAEMYPSCMGGGTTKYVGDQANCELYDNMGNLTGACLNREHFFYFTKERLEGLVGETLDLSILEKFYQAVGGTIDEANYYFIKSAPKINVIMDTQVDVFPKCILKDINNDTSPSSSCGTYCEKRNNSYYLKNGEVFTIDCFAQDERGNYATISNYNTTYSCDDGANWYGSLNQCPDTKVGLNPTGVTNNSIGFHGINSWRPRLNSDVVQFITKNKFDWVLDQYNSGTYEGDQQMVIDLPHMDLQPSLSFNSDESLTTTRDMILSNTNDSAYPKYYTLNDYWYVNKIDFAGHGDGPRNVDWLKSLDSPTSSNNMNVDGNKSVTFQVTKQYKQDKGAFVVLRSASASAGGTEVNHYSTYLNLTDNYITETDERVRQAIPAVNSGKTNPRLCDVNNGFELCNYIYQIINYAYNYNAPLPTCEISADPSSIDAGSESKLTFTAENATSATINGEGVGIPGEKMVSPISTTTYVMTATGDGGTGSCSAKVTVSSPDSSGRNLQGVFITKQVVDDTGDDEVKISQDPNVVNNPPPGFNDLFAPLWVELVP